MGLAPPGLLVWQAKSCQECQLLLLVLQLVLKLVLLLLLLVLLLLQY
jgi:hypothetical protein